MDARNTSENISLPNEFFTGKNIFEMTVKFQQQNIFFLANHELDSSQSNL